MKYFLIVIGIIVIGLSFWIGQSIEFNNQRPLYDGLRTTSAIVFGVVGAWMALVYPKTVEFMIQNKHEENIDLSDMEDANHLLRALVLSSLILAITLLVGLIAEFLKQFHWIVQSRDAFRGLSFSLLVFLSGIQIWAIFLSLVPVDKAKTKMDEYKEKKRLLKNIAQK